MKVEDIDKVQELINQRYCLLEIINASECWPGGHFAFVSHLGSNAEKLRVPSSLNVDNKILNVIRDKIKEIENVLEKF